MKKIFYVSIVSCLFFSGCTTTQTSPNNVKTVSADRIYSKEFFNETEERNVPLTISRDSGIWGAACNHRVYVNNKKMFAIKSGEQATIYLKPIEYEVKVDLFASSFCPYSQVEETINLEPNSPQSYRISSAMSVNDSLKLMKVN